MDPFDKTWNPLYVAMEALNETPMLQPLHWRKPRKIFVCSTTDLFGGWVEDGWLDRIFAIMALCPQHSFQVLTKRSQRMRQYCSDPRAPQRIAADILQMRVDGIISGRDTLGPLGNREHEEDPEFVRWPLPNVWLGVPAESQAAAEARIPDLLATPAAIRFVSAQPLREPVDLRAIMFSGGMLDALTTLPPRPTNSPKTALDWVLTGGENGPNARLSHPEWFRSIRDQCAAARVPYFHKQNGEWVSVLDRDKEDPDRCCDYSGVRHDKDRPLHGMHRVGKVRAGRLLDGVEHNEFPETSA
jgi:protein gp37